MSSPNNPMPAIILIRGHRSCLVAVDIRTWSMVGEIANLVPTRGGRSSKPCASDGLAAGIICVCVFNVAAVVVGRSPAESFGHSKPAFFAHVATSSFCIADQRWPCSWGVGRNCKILHPSSNTQLPGHTMCPWRSSYYRSRSMTTTPHVSGCRAFDQSIPQPRTHLP
ncbi:hypothetical protein VTK26DRAFT_4859 [Humicola hyalothermophila]